MPRPNTYQALEALTQRRAVLPVSENPARYVAADPQQLFDTIARQTRSLCTDLAKRLSAVTAPPDDQYVWTLRGDASVHDKIDALIGDAREVLWIKAAGEGVAPHPRNKPIVNLAQSLVRHDYYMAEIFARFGPQIEEAFGLHLRDLRLACFSPAGRRSFKERARG